MKKIVAMAMILFMGTLQSATAPNKIVEVTNKSNQKIKIRIEGFNPRMGYSKNFDIESGGTVQWEISATICVSKIIIEHDGKINLRKELRIGSCSPKKITLENPSGSNWTLKTE